MATLSPRFQQDMAQAAGQSGFQLSNHFCADFDTAIILLAQLAAPLLLLVCLPILWAELADSNSRREQQKEGNSSRWMKKYTVNNKPLPLPFGTLACLRYLLTLALISLKTLLLLEMAYQWLWLHMQVPVAELLLPITNLASLALLLHYGEQFRRAGLVPSGPIFCCWLLFTLGGVPEFLAQWQLINFCPIEEPSPAAAADLMLFRRFVQLLWLPLCGLQLLLHCFAGPIPLRADEGLNSSPETRVSFPNRQFLFWFDSLIRLGHRQPISERDVWRLEPAMHAKRLFQRWSQLDDSERKREIIKRGTSVTKSDQTHFKEDHFDHPNRKATGMRKFALMTASRNPSSKAVVANNSNNNDERTPLMPINSQNNSSCYSDGFDKSEKSNLKKKKNKKEYGTAVNRVDYEQQQKQHQELLSLIARLWRLFRWPVSGAMAAKLCSDLLQFATPLLLGQLITFTEQPSVPKWWGLVLAGSLFTVSQLSSLFLNTYFLLMNRVGCQVQSVLTCAVYAKTLKLSSAARRGRSSGEIVNLMAIDVDRFQQLTPLLQQLWSSPLQVVIALVLLYQQIGWAVAGGVFVMLALIPYNLTVVRFTRRWQMEQMVCKDQRLRTINEVLTGIRAVKLYAWEVPMQRAIEQIRQREVQLLRKTALLSTCSDLLNVTSPFLVAICAFALFIFPDPVKHQLTPQVAFVSLTLFSQLRGPMMSMAELVGALVQTAVSNRRLKQFIAAADEIDPEAVERGDLNRTEEEYVDGAALDMEFASFSWDRPAEWPILQKHSGLPPPAGQHHPEKHVPILNNLDLHIRRGQLVAVVGKVGAGKSSLLQAMLGEMHKVHGFVRLRGKLAYVPQQPWILNRSIRDNILFPVDDREQPDEQLYAQVVEACALGTDFAVLPRGDRTEIGERGINLSGGQKARVNLARALYKQADIFLLDDPLSAVDAIVGHQLFEQCIGPDSLAKRSTRVLVTHSLTYLSRCDWIVVMADGQIKYQGSYEAVQKEPEMAELIARLDDDAKEEEEAEEDDDNDEYEEKMRMVDDDETNLQQSSDEEVESLKGGSLASPLLLLRQRSKRNNRRSSSTSKSTMPKVLSAAMEEMPPELGKLVKDESAETGRVQPRIYRDYFAAMRWPLFLGFALFAVAEAVLSTVQNLWLSAWSDDNSPMAPAGQPKTSLTIRFGVYALQGVCLVLLLGLTFLFETLGSVSASIRLHGPLLARVLHAPVSFFDTTPLGRVLNRFGKEFDTVDLRLANAFRMLVLSFLMLVQLFVLICIPMPLFTLLLLPISLLYLFILRYFLPTSRQLQRLTSVARSPLYNLFAETIAGGTSSIRAYGVSQTFFDAFCTKLDIQIGCSYFSLIASRWLSIRLELIGNLVILFCSLLAVFSRDWVNTITAGLIGLAVSKSLKISFNLSFLVRSINDVEVSIVSVERIMEYSKMCPQEAAWHSQVGHGPSPGWPHQGAVSFRNFSCRYRPCLDLSLRSINAEIRAKEKIGVVGRTGAGKTSMALALFRIVEAAEGSILIDGLDIALVGLQELRSRITIIPQDPVLFSGTLRFNLDPFGAYPDDAELWAALEHVHLKQFVEAQMERLSHQVAESGENMSVGQRQLLCLARAILRRSPLIVLDEATASIDTQTDVLIQRAIRSEFQHSTILTIAHRISTVMDYDRIMVLANGRLVEFDTPAVLMANKQSHFYGLISQNGQQNLEEAA